MKFAYLPAAVVHAGKQEQLLAAGRDTDVGSELSQKPLHATACGEGVESVVGVQSEVENTDSVADREECLASFGAANED